MSAKMPTAGNAQPDKILYDRALNDYQHGRYTEARLSLQTLINSYPDSEYLAKAKLAVADSYYKEGGVEGLTQAVAEYKDFITFFPFLPEAAYAQMQVAMAHYRMMEKPDRDATQAQQAEEEFQTFLLKYPKDPLAQEAEQRLREVQEVLAQADFDVAHFYYLKGDYRASGARLIEVSSRYPLFSQCDHALWMLADIYRRAARGSKNEQERTRWRAQSDVEYARLIKFYPLSSLVPDAKRQLAEDGIPIPPPDPQALARAQYDEKVGQERPGMVHRALGMVKSSPNVQMAAKTGPPNLNPPGEVSGPPPDMLQGGAATTSTVTTASAGVPETGGAGATQTASVETVQPTESSSNPGESSSAPPVSASAIPTDPPSAGSSSSVSSSGTGTVLEPANPPGSSASPIKPNQTATDAEVAEELRGNRPAVANATAKSKPSKSTKAKQTKAPKNNNKTESTSKKKKGIHKLIPW
jgi:outer membrane protein assembly factor BamD